MRLSHWTEKLLKPGALSAFLAIILITIFSISFILDAGPNAAAATVPPPTTPTNLKAMVVSATQINLTWTASTSKVGVAGYNIYINNTLAGNSPHNSYSAAGLAPKTKYTFKVSAYDTAGHTSAQSSSVSATTLTDTTAPSTPGNFAASNVLSTSLTLSWSASTDNVGVSGYKVYVNGTLSATINALQYSLTNLTTGSSYTFSVKAYDAAGNLSAAATLSITPVLPAPANLQAASLTYSSVGLSWTQPVSDPKITGYVVTRNGSSLATVTTTSYTDVSVAANTAYSYSVAAINASGQQSSAVTLSLTTPPVPVSAPDGLQADAVSSTQAGITWQASSGSIPVSSYSIYRNGAKIATTPDAYTTNYFDSGLSASTGYTYTVVANGQNGTISAQSSALNVTTGGVATPITGCGTISAPGNYVLSGNIYANGSTCLTISNTTNVTLDCQNYTISPAAGTSAPSPLLSITGVQNFMLANCTITPSALVVSLSIQNDSYGILVNDTFSGGGYVNVNSSNNLVLSGDTLTNGFYQQYSSSNNYLGFDSVSYSGFNGASLLLSNGGSGNILDNDTLNGYGAFTPPNTYTGFDDGIVLDFENNDTVVNNSISNVWDSGIETGGLVSNSLLANNNINATYVSGIGGWDWNSWLGNTVSGNTVSNTEQMFNFFNQYGLAASQANLYFENNSFINNTLLSPVASALGSSSSYIDMDYADNPSIPAGSVIAGNNVFKGNNFGKTQSAPLLWPAAMITDGGGNICGPMNFNKESQLFCN